MKINLPNLFCSLMIVMSLGCGFSTEKRRPKALEKRLEQRSIKKISEADIMQSAEQLGDTVISVAQATLMNKLMKKIDKGDYATAVNFCAGNAQFITDSIAKQYAVQLKRVSLKNRNRNDAPTSLEKNLLEAYAYSAEQKQALSPNLQFYGEEDSILYNRPIFIASPVCLNCHGAKDKINELTKEVIVKNYPQDSAHGYQLGDFRGMWSVSMAKTQLIKRIYN